jgi:hypothetical protein
MSNTPNALENMKDHERYEFFVNEGIAFHLFVDEVEDKYQDEYAQVCIAEERIDLLMS